MLLIKNYLTCFDIGILLFSDPWHAAMHRVHRRHRRAHHPPHERPGGLSRAPLRARIQIHRHGNKFI